MTTAADRCSRSTPRASVGASELRPSARRARAWSSDADGSTAHADAVVGADGHGSAVRRQWRPEDDGRPTGWTTWQGMTPAADGLVEPSTILTMTGPSGFCGLQPAGDGLLQWYFGVPPGGPAPTSPGAAAALGERFAGFAPPVPAVLEGVTDAELVPWTHLAQPVRRIWGTGRATLLGDAAHTMPPSMAQGVNQTLEDAHALVGALTRAEGDISTALRRYERVRSRRVARIARMAGSEASTTYRRSTQLLMRAMPDLAGTNIYRGLLERSSSFLRS